jgi:hypothetical protein
VGISQYHLRPESGIPSHRVISVGRQAAFFLVFRVTSAQATAFLGKYLTDNAKVSPLLVQIGGRRPTAA